MALLLIWKADDLPSISTESDKNSGWVAAQDCEVDVDFCRQPVFFDEQ